MFFKKKKAAKAAFEAIEIVLKNFENAQKIMGINGMPEGFWHDPFVLGYFDTVIHFFGKTAVDNQISTEDMGTISMDILGKISGAPKLEIGKKVVDYMTNKNEEFLLGVENATKCILTMGPIDEKLLNDPDVLEARKLMNDSNLDPITSGSISGTLTYLLFYSELKRRFWDK